MTLWVDDRPPVASLNVTKRIMNDKNESFEGVCRFFLFFSENRVDRPFWKLEKNLDFFLDIDSYPFGSGRRKFTL